MDNFIKFVDVKKTYKVGEMEIHAVDGVSFTIKKGDFTIVVGASGAGKSTVLNILGGMDFVSSGQFYVDGDEISKFKPVELTTYRRNDIGFVFQFYNLVQNLNALENVELATEICKDSFDPQMILKQVGLEDRLYNFPSQLSGGEQQRVAIARALAKNPKLLLCDEPTGALDYIAAKEILKLITQVNEKFATTVIIITHNTAISGIASRIIKLRSGAISENVLNGNVLSAERIEW